MNSENDFVFLGRACEISSITHTAVFEYRCIEQEKQCTDQFCVDYYQYYFTLNTTKGKSDEVIYKGFQEDQRRSGEDKKCTSSTSIQIPSELHVELEVQCWQPSTSTSTDYINKWYDCYNEQCLKIEDPGNGIDDYRSEQEGLQRIGFGMTAGSLVGVVAYCYMIYHRMKYGLKL